MKITHLERRLTCAMLALGLCHFAGAQESGDEDDIYTLSPFSVDASDNTGYRARSTLAGTRINSNLEDVAASIQVITKEFLEDTGATNVEELLTYTTSTEVVGPEGNFTDFNSANGRIRDSHVESNTSTTRVRGLASADITRNYFGTPVPFDSYNIDSVTINRGPNSALFGLGSPAGILNYSLIRPQYRDTNEVELRYGSFDSYRASFDFNRVVLDDQLAVRVAGLYDDKKFRQDPAFDENQRLFITGEYKPEFMKRGILSGTVLRVDYEVGENEGNKPRLLTPTDQIKAWFNVGKASRPSSTGSAGADRSIFGVTQRQFWHPTVVYDVESNNPNNFADSSYGNGTVGFTHVATIPPEGTHIMWAMEEWAEHLRRIGFPGAGFYSDLALNDPNVFDFYNHSIHGPSKREFYDFDALGVTLEQRMFEDSLGFELVYNEQEYTRGWLNPWASDGDIINVDTATDLFDGTPNPNFGRPFLTGNGRRSWGRTQNQTFRATAFYKFDFRNVFDSKWGERLGNHVLTGLFNSSNSNTQSRGGFMHLWDESWTTDYGGRPNNRSNLRQRYGHKVYLGPSIANMANPGDARVFAPKFDLVDPVGLNFHVFNEATGEFEQRSFGAYLGDDELTLTGNGGNWGGNEIDSQAVVWQSFFLDGKIVGTFGWRKDEPKVFSSGNPPRTDNNWWRYDQWEYAEEPSLEAEGQTRTYGLVVHLTDFFAEFADGKFGLSVHYNESENFEPAGLSFNTMLEQNSAPGGVTEEYGFTLSLMEEKLVARVNLFETSQTGVNAGVPTNIGFRFFELPFNAGMTVGEMFDKGFINSLTSTSYADLFDADIAPHLEFHGVTFNRNDQGTADPRDDTLNVSTASQPQRELSNVTSEGMELELIYNPNQNWRMALNVAQVESARSDSATALAEFIDTFDYLWEPFGDGPNEIFVGATRTQNIQERMRNDFVIPLLSVQSRDGIPVQELKEWRANFVTSYRFTEGPMAKWGIGGAMRWEDESAIGYPVFFDDELNDYAPVVSNPFYGPTDLSVDAFVSRKLKLWNEKVDLHLQLNVRNLLYDKDLEPVGRNPDGTTFAYRIPSPRTWELTARFDF